MDLSACFTSSQDARRYAALLHRVFYLQKEEFRSAAQNRRRVWITFIYLLFFFVDLRENRTFLMESSRFVFSLISFSRERWEFWRTDKHSLTKDFRRRDPDLQRDSRGDTRRGFSFLRAGAFPLDRGTERHDGADQSQRRIYLSELTVYSVHFCVCAVIYFISCSLDLFSSSVWRYSK